MDVNEILSELETLRNAGTRVPGFRGKIMVESDKLVRLSESIKSGMPADIEEAQALVDPTLQFALRGTSATLITSGHPTTSAVSLTSTPDRATEVTVAEESARGNFTDISPSAASGSVALRVTVIIPFSFPLPVTSATTGVSFVGVIVTEAVAILESVLPSLALYVKLSFVVSLPSWV